MRKKRFLARKVGWFTSLYAGALRGKIRDENSVYSKYVAKNVVAKK